MSSMSRNLFLTAFVLGCATSAGAQSINIDIGSQPPFSPVPLPTYGGAAGQAGTWNNIPEFVPIPLPLVDINGVMTGVSLGNSGAGGTLHSDDPGTLRGDQDLLDDTQFIGGAGQSTTWTFSGLANGGYRLFTYAWAPNFQFFTCSVSAGTVTPPQLCGGPWPGMQLQNVTYTVHDFSTSAGSQLVVTLQVVGDGGALGGFQLVQLPPPGAYVCFGDGSTGSPCPTGNNSMVGAQQGCLNSLGNGAIIEATGNPSITADTIQFQGSGMPFGTCLYFQADNVLAGGASVPFGDGIACISGTVRRLGIKLNMHGSSVWPGPGDNPVSGQGGVSTPGFRYYEVWYRDAAGFGSGATHNISRTVCIPWVP